MWMGGGEQNRKKMESVSGELKSAAPAPPLHSSTHVKAGCTVAPIFQSSSRRKYRPSGRSARNQSGSQIGFRSCKPPVMVGEGVRNDLPGPGGRGDLEGGIQFHHRRGKPHQSLDIGSRDPTRGCHEILPILPGLGLRTKQFIPARRVSP